MPGMTDDGRDRRWNVGPLVHTVGLFSWFVYVVFRVLEDGWTVGNVLAAGAGLVVVAPLVWWRPTTRLSTRRIESRKRLLLVVMILVWLVVTPLAYVNRGAEDGGRAPFEWPQLLLLYVVCGVFLCGMYILIVWNALNRSKAESEDDGTEPKRGWPR
jgi:hypothetical protein